MAKDKTKYPMQDGSYGKIVKREASNMFVTNKGFKIPPFPKLKIGDEVIMEGGKYKIGDGSDEKVSNDVPATQEDIKALKDELEKERSARKNLEKLVGEQGENMKNNKGEGSEK